MSLADRPAFSWEWFSTKDKSFSRSQYGWPLLLSIAILNSVPGIDNIARSNEVTKPLGYLPPFTSYRVSSSFFCTSRMGRQFRAESFYSMRNGLFLFLFYKSDGIPTVHRSVIVWTECLPGPGFRDSMFAYIDPYVSSVVTSRKSENRVRTPMNDLFTMTK